jgi:flagellar protein FlaG
MLPRAGLAGPGCSTKEITMIIQPTNPLVHQATVPDVRPVAPAPARAVSASAPEISVRPPSPEELKQAVAAINQAMKQSNRNLEFMVDSDTDRTVVRMVDTSTGELIRQFPTETTLAISRGIEQFQQGLLLRQKA